MIIRCRRLRFEVRLDRIGLIAWSGKFRGLFISCVAAVVIL